MDLHGNMVGKSNLKPGVAITEMAWNCERFNMEEQSGSNENGQQNLNIFPPTSNNAQQPKQPQPYLRPDGKKDMFCLLFCSGHSATEINFGRLNKPLILCKQNQVIQ